MSQHAPRRPRRLGWVVAAACLSASGGIARADDAKPATDGFVFRDVGDAAGLFPHVAGIRGHGAGWGDADGDGFADLYVATFHNEGSKAGQFFRNVNGKFTLDEQPALRISTRATGVVFADLDNDGDLDLYVASMPQTPKSKDGKAPPPALAGCTLFRNDGGGKYANVSENNAACPPTFGGRSATVLDFDGDGLLDLLVGEDPLPGYNGSKTRSSRLFRNKGDLKFEDVSRAAGIPDDTPGLGVAAADVNNDGWPDVFCAAHVNGPVLLLNDGAGKFREAPGSRETFAWPAAKGDNMVTGICFADVNRDGLLDAAVGQHFQDPWRTPIANRVYLNRGIGKDGVPKFEDVTDAAGLVPLPMKGPHVELRDFDNDGWPDLYTSIVKFAKDGTPHPMIFKNLGAPAGDAKATPRFRERVLAVNDFPNDEDRATKRSGTLFDKLIKDGRIIYMAPGPSADFDNDGRLDLFLANWWVEGRSLLLHNETPGGHWLDVRIEGSGGVNRMGIGSRVNVYPAGKLGDAASLLGRVDIATGYGYASGQPAIAHFGLGKEEKVDVEVILPHGKGTLVQKDVKADQRITVKR